jgi:two-component system, LytTR family, response regulator
MQFFHNKIVIPGKKSREFIETGSIVRIEASGNYSKLFLVTGQIILVTGILKRFEESLSAFGFTRVHRSHLVNTGFIKSCNTAHKEIVLQNQEVLSMSRRKKSSLRKQLLLLPAA